MKTNRIFLLAALPLLLAACKNAAPDDSFPNEYGEIKDMSGEWDGVGAPGGSNSGGQGEDMAGLVTASEWNDLAHWDFWGNLMNNQELYGYTETWKFFTNHRVAVRVAQSGSPVCGAKVRLSDGSGAVWNAVTDNKGECSLWYSLYQRTSNADDASLPLSIAIDGVAQPGTPVVTAWNSPEVLWNEYEAAPNSLQGVDIAFIVDATGSMTDEIDFLKADVLDIINGIDQQAAVRTAALFYRDEDDEYVTRVSNFSESPAVTYSFVNEQYADGGGDWPEAVHTAFEVSLQSLSWNAASRVKLAFWLLDAPPHEEPAVIASIQQSVKTYASMGIRLIPVAASGIDKSTEILLRNFAVVTGGTYVFITDDSGIGGEHIEATVGECEVEALNSLIVRLINEYTR